VLRRAGALLGVVLLACACASPVGVTQCGFDCEVAERVDAADASQSKPEGGPVETDPARRP
jgi:hypothetical protein